VASIGFHLGRLSSGLEAATPRAALEAHVDARRSLHFGILQEIAARAPVSAIAPPPMGGGAREDLLRDIIGARIGALGIPCLDTRKLLVPGETRLPAEEMEDAGHANSSYGRRVIAALAAAGAPLPQLPGR
jgi:hypothetical protein